MDNNNDKQLSTISLIRFGFPLLRFVCIFCRLPLSPLCSVEMFVCNRDIQNVGHRFVTHYKTTKFWR